MSDAFDTISAAGGDTDKRANAYRSVKKALKQHVLFFSPVKFLLLNIPSCDVCTSEGNIVTVERDTKDSKSTFKIDGIVCTIDLNYIHMTGAVTIATSPSMLTL